MDGPYAAERAIQLARDVESIAQVQRLIDAERQQSLQDQLNLFLQLLDALEAVDLETCNLSTRLGLVNALELATATLIRTALSLVSNGASTTPQATALAEALFTATTGSGALANSLFRNSSIDGRSLTALKILVAQWQFPDGSQQQSDRNT